MLSEPLLRRWLRDVKAGRRSIERVVQALRRPPIEPLGFARLDMHRRLRRGLPESVLCQGKQPQQLARIARRFVQARELLLLTRLDEEVAGRLRREMPALRYDPVARLGYWIPGRRAAARGHVVVASGGTADLPVAEEAALTLDVLGSRTTRLFDVGVAGIHRLLNASGALGRARAVVVVAGMEGALASVVGGLVRCPVIAVPTSIGYGAHFGGVAPLLAMLNSCVPGVAVVNIDNGFGAGYMAHVINLTPRR